MLHHQAGGAGEIEDDAHEAVDGDLGHHAAHQRRDVARRRRMRERQPDMQRHDAGLRAGADQRQDQGQRAERRRGMRGAHLREGIKAVGPGEQAEGEQQSERAEARHHQIDVAGAHVVGHAVVRHHQRPRGQRHELPGDQEGEGVVGEHDQRHAGEKGGIERQHALRRRLVLAVAEREQARARGAEIDHGEEEGGRARRGGNARRARAGRAAASGVRRRGAEQMRAAAATSEIVAIDNARAVDDARRRCGNAPIDHGEHAKREQSRGAGERDRQRHGAGLFEPHAAAAAVARRVVGNQLDAERRRARRRASSAN